MDRPKQSNDATSGTLALPKANARDPQLRRGALVKQLQKTLEKAQKQLTELSVQHVTLLGRLTALSALVAHSGAMMQLLARAGRSAGMPQLAKEHQYLMLQLDSTMKEEASCSSSTESAPLALPVELNWTVEGALCRMPTEDASTQGCLSWLKGHVTKCRHLLYRVQHRAPDWEEAALQLGGERVSMLTFCASVSAVVLLRPPGGTPPPMDVYTHQLDGGALTPDGAGERGGADYGGADSGGSRRACTGGGGGGGEGGSGGGGGGGKADLVPAALDESLVARPGASHWRWVVEQMRLTPEQDAAVRALTQIWKSQFDRLSQRRRELQGRLGQGHLAAQALVVRQLGALQMLEAFQTNMHTMTLHGSLLSPEQHAATMVASDPFLPSAHDVYSGLFGGGGGGSGAVDGGG